MGLHLTFPTRIGLTPQATELRVVPNKSFYIPILLWRTREMTTVFTHLMDPS